MVAFAFTEPARALSYFIKEREAARLAEAKAKAEAAPALFKPNLPAPAEDVPAMPAVPAVPAREPAATAEVLTPGAALARVHEVMAQLQAAQTDNGIARVASAGGHS